jgi:large subunit ribosomal protein L15e
MFAVTQESRCEVRRINMGMYKYIKKAYQERSAELENEIRKRQIDWRAENSVQRIERPTNLSSARRLGYRAKEGIMMVRVRLPRGGKQRPSIRHGRRSRNFGQRFVMGKGYQLMAEERANKRFPNLEVLNSYMAGKDGTSYWFEVILVDPVSPSIIKDKQLNWMSNPKHTGRVYRGLTSSGKKSRGLMYKGKGAEKHRPSMNAHLDRGK